MRQRARWFFLFVAICRIAGAAEPGCQLHEPALRVPRANIFNEQQEQWLGDAQAAMVEPRYTLVPEADTAYLNAIAQKLLAQLPPTSIHYTIGVFESADLRAFSLAGGRIYISLKLIMDARNEDELAAMIAQEVGRVYTHHSASSVTLRLNKLMHVKTLGDQADVADKFARLLNVPETDASQLNADDEKRDDLLADQVGLYALIRAKYAPEAFATFLDRVNNNGGYTGSWFTDLADATPEVSIRVRTAHKTVDALSTSCRRSRPVYAPGFKPFQSAMRSRQFDPVLPATEGLTSIALDPPMSPALENVVLSADGKYAIAQDESKIHVLTTSPLKLEFSVDALGAEMAQFTPDSRGLVFNYNDLHIEKWELATGRPVDIVDFVDYAGCVQTSLSPDGNVMACISMIGDSVWLKLVDVNTDRMLYQNPKFYDHSYMPLNTNMPVQFNRGFQALMRWTRDGRYFVAASGPDRMAYDVEQHQAVQLQKTLSGLEQERFAFVGSDKMLSTCDWSYKTGTEADTYRMCLTTFPGGLDLGKFQMPTGWLTSLTAGDGVLFGPTNDAAAVIVDPATGIVQREFRLETVDKAGDQVATEIQTGGIAVGRLNGKPESIDLPVTPLAGVEASAFSADGRYLAVSDRARGAEWDLSSGKRIAETGPFRAVDFDSGGKLQARIVHRELNPATDTSIDRRTHKFVYGATSAGEPVQYGNILFRFKPLSFQQAVDRDVALEAYDATTEARLWQMRFDDYLPKMIPADGEQILFVMDRRSLTGASEASRNRKVLVHTSDDIKRIIDEQGTLIEVLQSRTGVVEHAIAAPQLASNRREERAAGLYGNLLAVYGNSNDTSVYRVSDGARVLAFFGRALAGDDRLGMIAATNRPQELTVYDVANGRMLMSVLLDENVLAARFVPERKLLLVLTASQHVYQVSLDRLTRTH